MDGFRLTTLVILVLLMFLLHPPEYNTMKVQGSFHVSGSYEKGRCHYWRFLAYLSTEVCFTLCRSRYFSRDIACTAFAHVGSCYREVAGVAPRSSSSAFCDNAVLVSSSLVRKASRNFSVSSAVGDGEGLLDPWGAGGIPVDVGQGVCPWEVLPFWKILVREF